MRLDRQGQEGVRIIYNDGEICEAPGAPRVPRLTVLGMFPTSRSDLGTIFEVVDCAMILVCVVACC